jgi:hypothetical protein
MPPPQYDATGTNSELYNANTEAWGKRRKYGCPTLGFGGSLRSFERSLVRGGPRGVAADGIGNCGGRAMTWTSSDLKRGPTRGSWFFALARDRTLVSARRRLRELGRRPPEPIGR